MAAGFVRGQFHEVQATLHGGKPSGDGRGGVRQAFDGGDQEQHGGDKCHESAHCRRVFRALHQRNRNNGRKRHGGKHLGDGTHAGISRS